MRTKILLTLIVFSFLVPVLVKAAGVTPELNPICWREKDCQTARSKFNIDPSNSGWLKNEDPCNSPEWGKCLPTSQTKTTISFGGRKSFSDIGDFIKYNYNLALSIAGILAVIMMVVAGIQWVTSGGNSEMISSAKKRIGGALIGLLIAYLSYTILNTVNPALVNLRLPQVYMIRPVNLVLGNNCVDLEKPWKVAPVKDATEVPAENTFIDPFKEFDLKDICKDDVSNAKALNPFREDFTKCGQMYLVKDGGGNTCMGTKCDKEEVCNKNKCEKFVSPGGGQNNGIMGKISFSDDKYLDGLQLYAACKDGSSVKVNPEMGKGNGFLSYASTNINLSNDSGTYCGGFDNIDGFFFEMEVNDSDTAPSKDDEWIGGISLCKNISGGGSCGAWGGNSIDAEEKSLAVLSMGLNGQLIPAENLKNGFICDLDINPQSMPNIGNGILQSTGAGLVGMVFSEKGVKLAQKVDLLKQENYIAGVNYSCAAFDKSAGAFQAKLKKVQCKCWDTWSENAKQKHPKDEFCSN